VDGKEGAMSIIYMGFGWKLDLEPAELLVYLAIADHVHDDGEGCYASYKTLAEKTNLGRSTVIRVVDKLQKAGILVHQGTHPVHHTNVWNIDKDKLPFKEPARNGKEAPSDPAPAPTKRQKGAASGAIATPGITTTPDVTATPGITTTPDVTATPRAYHTDTLASPTVTPPQYHSGTAAGVTAGPKPLVEPLEEPLEEPSENHPRNHPSSYSRYDSGGKEALPPAMDAQVNPAAKTRVLRERADSGTYPNNPDDTRARDQPETALQTKIAQLTNSRYLSASIKARLRSTVSVAWGDSKLPVTRPSPEDEWAAHPELFAEYVELCARRIREESGQPPSRDKLVQSVRNYARYNTGWLDFRKAAQEEKGQAQQRAHPSAKQNQWYYDPSKPDWMQ
jgi:hypothetical protein